MYYQFTIWASFTVNHQMQYQNTFAVQFTYQRTVWKHKRLDLKYDEIQEQLRTYFVDTYRKISESS